MTPSGSRKSKDKDILCKIRRRLPAHQSDDLELRPVFHRLGERVHRLARPAQRSARARAKAGH